MGLIFRLLVSIAYPNLIHQLGPSERSVKRVARICSIALSLPMSILFQGQADFELKGQIFIDKKPTYYDFANETNMLTEVQVFEKYAPD